MDTEEGSPGTQSTDARKALERFVVENDDLLALESRIGWFNIFDALGITHVEIRHSNFLAFILDPAESHGKGPLFLKTVLMDLLKQAPPNLRPLSPIDLDGTDLRGVEVKREWKNIDLLITCKEPPFAVVIENKVGAREHSNQLSRYQRTMTDHYPGLPVLYVYLTPDGDEPSEDSWLPYTYAEIHGVLSRVRASHQKAIGDDVLVFLDHYLHLLGTRFMNDEKLDELCRRIYKNHRQALDLIWERVGSPESGVMNEVANVLEEDSRWEVVWRVSKQVNFVPKAWLKWLPPLGTDYSDPRVWFVLKFRLDDGKLDSWAEVQVMANVAKRRQFVKVLLDEAPKCGFKPQPGRKVTDKYTRISGRENLLEWGAEGEPEPEAIRLAVKKTLDELYPKLEKLAAVLKPLCKPPASAK